MEAIATPELQYDPVFHRYTLGEQELPSVTRIIESHGLISSFSKDEAAALRGSYAHLACRYLFENRLDWSTVDINIMGYVLSLYHWIEASKFQAIACEVMQWHRWLFYAGTLDVIGLHPEYGRLLIDLKSGSREAWHPWQTQLYALMTPGHHKRGALYLQKDGRIAKFYRHTNLADKANAISLVNVYHLKEMAA